MQQKKRNKTIARKMMVVTMLVLSSICGKSQLATLIANEISAINKAYDSAFYLTFDVRIVYHTDTLFAGSDTADFTHTEMNGVYTFHGKKAMYVLGDIEFMQNEKYAIGVYKDNKMMLVGKPDTTQKPGMFIPTRALFDSMMARLVDEYSFSRTYVDSSFHRMTFNALDSNNLYEQIIVEYDSVSHFLSKVQYRFIDREYMGGEAYTISTYDGVKVARRADFIYYFSNYRAAPLAEATFDITRYLFFDGPDDFKPSRAYGDYTIFKNY